MTPEEVSPPVIYSTAEVARALERSRHVGERSNWAMFRKELQNSVKYGERWLVDAVATYEERIEAARGGRSPWWPQRIEAWDYDGVAPRQLVRCHQRTMCLP